MLVFNILRSYIWKILYLYQVLTYVCRLYWFLMSTIFPSTEFLRMKDKIATNFWIFRIFQVTKKSNYSILEYSARTHPIMRFLTKILELTLSCVSQNMQYSPSGKSGRIPNSWKKRLIVTCHKKAFSFTLRSNAIVQTSWLRIIRSGIFNLRRVVLLRYCSRCVW